VRPVNLIPPEERRGDRAPSRTGALAYVVIGVLAVAVAAVSAVVLTGNQISDRKTKVASLNAELGQVTAEAKRLQSYAAFATNEQARVQSVRSLALSRFDWYRVLHELSLVIPRDVWLTHLQGSVTPDAGVASGAGASTGGSSADVTSQILGPSLELDGCAAGHDAVASFIGALKQIDGVTRVVVTSSERSNGGSSGSSGPTGSAASSSECAARNFIASVTAVVSFDKVPIDPATGTIAPPQETAPAPSDGTGPGLASARKQEAQLKHSASQQTDKAHQAVSTLIPGAVNP
jgi:Tfp pilus assembly protein PilN